MTNPLTAHAVIDLDVPGPRISRHVYGHFAEHLGRCIYDGFYVGEDSPIPNEGGIRSDVVAALRQIGIPNLRWPGGCFADEYHWRDGIGPKADRPRMVNTHWGDVEENNHFGTHEFMALCELLGADAYVNGNVGSGTVQEMSEWVEYLTRAGDSPMARLRRENGRDEPWKVPFWGIGNEAWGCGGKMTAEHYAAEARRYATFCRDHGDNKLYRIAAGASDDDVKWTKTLMESLNCLGCQREPTNIFQAISFHYYTTGAWEERGNATGFTTSDYYATMSKAQDVERVLSAHATVMDAYDPAKKVGLVLDEWGTWWDVEEGTNPGFLFQQNTMRDALVASVHFDVFHRHADRLVMANIAQTVNVLQAMLLTDATTGALVLTPTYHVFEMNRGHHDATSLAVHVLEQPETRTEGGRPLDVLSVSASTRDDNTALISLSNLDAEHPLDVVLDLRGRNVAAHTGRVLTGAQLQTHNTASEPDAVAPAELTAIEADDRGLRVTLPPHSFATVSLTLG